MKPNSKIRFFDYFFVMRPTLFFPIWTVFLAGYNANIIFDTKKYNQVSEIVSGSNPIFVLILISLLMGAVYIYNQLVDIESDAKNNKIFFIADGIVSVKIAKVEALILTIFSIGFALLLNKNLGLMFIFLFILIGIIYNFKPFNWKDKPFLSIVAHFVGGWMLAACGWITAGTNNWLFVIYAIPYALGFVAVYLLTTIPDIDGDREYQKITFSVKYGIKLTTHWALVFEILAIVVSFILKDYLMFIPALASFPLFLIAAVKKNEKNILTAIKYTILFLSLAVCVLYPLYFLLIFMNFYFSKWYYRVRFNIEYPKFAA